MSNAIARDAIYRRRRFQRNRPVWAAWPAERGARMMVYVGTSQVST
jgi:hypothetical protein